MNIWTHILYNSVWRFGKMMQFLIFLIVCCSSITFQILWKLASLWYRPFIHLHPSSRIVLPCCYMCLVCVLCDRRMPCLPTVLSLAFSVPCRIDSLFWPALALGTWQDAWASGKAPHCQILCDELAVILKKTGPRLDQSHDTFKRKRVMGPLPYQVYCCSLRSKKETEAFHLSLTFWII